MSTQNPFQPQALIGNPYSDAYFGSFRQQMRVAAPVCAFCHAALPDTRMSDGKLAWCHEGHFNLWNKWQQDEKLRREMINKFGKVV